MSLLKVFGFAYGAVLVLSILAMIGCIGMVISRLSKKYPWLSMQLGATLLFLIVFSFAVGLQFGKVLIPVLLCIWFLVGAVFCAVFLKEFIFHETHAEIEGPITMFVLVFFSSVVPVIMFGAVYHVFFT